MNTVLSTMKTAMKNRNDGYILENDVEALLFGIYECQVCSKMIRTVDNQAI